MLWRGWHRVPCLGPEPGVTAPRAFRVSDGRWEGSCPYRPRSPSNLRSGATHNVGGRGFAWISCLQCKGTAVTPGLGLAKPLSLPVYMPPMRDFDYKPGSLGLAPTCARHSTTGTGRAHTHTQARRCSTPRATGSRFLEVTGCTGPVGPGSWPCRPWVLAL